MSLLIQLSFANHNCFINSGFQTTRLHQRLTEVITFPSEFPQFLPVLISPILLLPFLLFSESKPVHVSFSQWSLAPWAGCKHPIIPFLHGLDTTSPFFFSPWVGCNQPIILFSMGWMQTPHYSFFCGLDATSPFFFSPWAGCNQPVFLFSMGWIQPAHFSFLHGLDETSPFFLCKYFRFMAHNFTS